MLVCAVIVGPVSIHFVEDLREVVTDLILHRNLLLKQIHIVHLCPALDIRHLVRQRVSLLHIWNEHLMDLSTKLLLCFRADRVDD